MTKVYCDICGKVIDSTENEYKLTCFELDKNSMQYHYAYTGDNVCGTCIESINDYITKNLKQKVGD